MIDFNDIAIHLSRIVRFTGAATINVAHHSVLVAHLVPTDLKLHGLLHDAHEAYVGDHGTPLKNLLATISPLFADMLRDIKRRWDFAIWEAAGLKPPGKDEHEAIKRADHMALSIERRDFLALPADELTRKAWAWLPLPAANVRLTPLSSELSRDAFLTHLADCLWPKTPAGHA